MKESPSSNSQSLTETSTLLCEFIDACELQGIPFELPDQETGISESFLPCISHVPNPGDQVLWTMDLPTESSWLAGPGQAVSFYHQQTPSEQQPIINPIDHTGLVVPDIPDFYIPEYRLEDII